MIERAITSKDIDSRFYKHNLRLAEKWEEFCKKYKGEITGIINSAILEFQLNLSIDNFDIQINGLRQHSNVNAGGITKFSMTKNTVITINPINYGRENWKIYVSNKLRNFFNKLIGKCNTYNAAQGFSITSRKEIDDHWKSSIFKLNKLFEIAKIRTISYSKATLRIEYLTLLGTQSVEELVSLINNSND